MKVAVRVLLAVLFAGAARAQEERTPALEGFRLSGEQWTCVADGKPLSGLLLKPEGAGPFPAILLSHGLGGNAQAMMRARGAELVKWGFVCIATDYTHAGKGGGRGSRDSVDFSQAGARPENVRRGLACLEILRQQPEVDPKRIALYGHSMGAFLTIALAAAAPDKVAAAAITAGGVVAGGYRAGSAPTAEVADRVRAPFLILHGTADTTVAPVSSERLKQSLDSHGVPNARHLFEGVGHGLPNEKPEEVNRLLREWFTTHKVLRAAGGPSESQAAAPQWVTPAAEAPRLQRRTVRSSAVGADVSYHVFLPEGYDAEAERRFPVLYWLHGSGGGLPGLPELAQRFDAAMRAGKMPPALVVFPNGLPGGMWCDSKDGRTPVETFVIKELLPHIDAAFRTVASREGRALDGFSMGGYGAARLGFKYPELFCAVSLLGAGPLQPQLSEAPRVGPRGREQILQAVYGSDPEYFFAQSPWLLAEAHAPALRGRTLIRQAIGDRDETSAFNRQFHERLVSLAIPHTFVALPGVGHEPTKVIDALGDAFWSFYRAAFAQAKAPSPSAR